MTLPNDDVMELLQERFVLGTRNIERDGHVGTSHGYACDQTAVGTTNGAGGRNVQIVILAADETVVHALPGFWHPQDLLPELRLALELYQLHVDETRSPAAKQAMFAALHRAHLRRHGDAATSRGAWQGFDAAYELSRAEREARDSVITGAGGQRAVKPLPQLVHERLLARPFRRLADFGMEAFVDYGRPYYDNNVGLDDGRRFPRAEHANAERERAEAAARKRQERDAEKAARAEQRAKGKRRSAPVARVTDPF